MVSSREVQQNRTVRQLTADDSNFGSLFESNLQKLLSYISFHLKMNLSSELYLALKALDEHFTLQRGTEVYEHSTVFLHIDYTWPPS